MNKKNKKILITVAIFIALSSIYFFYSKTTTKEISPSFDKVLKDDVPGEISVYDFMSKLRNEGKIDFKSENYIGMGEFVEEIDGLRNGEKNWIYYVNNKKADIGISNYKINSGDTVTWKYENEI